MNWDGKLPHDGWSLAGLIVIALVFWAMYRQKRVDDNIRGLHASVKRIDGQVVNSHDNPDTPNMRQDLDRLKADVTSIMASLAEWAPFIPLVKNFAADMTALRRENAEEFSAERAARRDLARDVREDLARNRHEVDQLRQQEADSDELRTRRGHAGG